MFRLFRKLITPALLLFVFAFTQPGGAQDFRATVTGRIADTSDAAIPNASVTVQNTATGDKFTTTSGGDGNYTVPFLVPGTYTVSAEAPGFKTSSRANIQLHVGDKTTVDLPMSIGGVNDTITVSAEPPLLDEASATRGGLIENLRVTELPLNGRNPFMLSNLVPGVVFAGNPAFTRPFDNGDNANFSINGGLRQTNEFLIDGAPDDAITDTAGDRTHANQNVAYIPTVDATQEFKIITNFYDAQYGRTGGGVISVSTKSGANTYHGSVYDFIRRYQLDANSFAAKSVTPQRPRYTVDPVTKKNLGGHSLDQYGFVLDGPASIPHIYNAKDRTFFMMGFENYVESTPSPTLTSVPNVAERSGDFSKSGFNIYDPLTTRLNPAFDTTKPDTATNPRYIRDQFQSNGVLNVIPAGRMDTVGAKILAAYPLPNVGDASLRFNNYIASPNLSSDHFRNYIGRVDQNFGQRERMYVRYAHNRRNQIDNGANGYTGVGKDAQDPLVRVNDNVVIDSLTAFNPRVILDLRASFARYNESALRQSVYGFDDTLLGFPKAFSDARFTPIPPRISVSGYPDFGTRNQRYNISNSLVFQPSLSVIKGKHSIMVGAQLRDIRINTASGSFVYGGGQFSFTNNFTQRSPEFNDSTTGAATASLAIGAPASGIISYTPALSYRFGYYALFVQDDIKLTQRITINAGLRYDIEGSPTERHNRQNRGFAFNQASPLAAAAKSANPTDCPACANLTGGLLFAGTGGQPSAAFNTDYNHIQPRIGAVYQFAPTIIFRGGYGLFYLPEAAFGGVQGFAADTPFVSTSGGGANSFIPATTLSNPFPSGLLQPTGTSLGLGTFEGNSVIFNNPNRKIPHVHQFSFGVQQQFPFAIKVDASYVGSRTVNVNTNDNQAGGARNLNVLSADQLAQARQNPTYFTQSVPNPFAGLLPGTSLNGPTVQRQQLLLPYPQFTSVTEGQESVGKIWYDSAQVSVEKRYSAGLVLVAAYTWSKNLEAVAFLNNQDSAPSKSLTSTDRPQRLVLSGVYQLPFGRGKRFASHVNRAVEQLIGGWEYNFLTTFQSGVPTDLPSNVDIIGNVVNPNQSFTQYFNTCVRQLNGTAVQPNGSHTAFNQTCSTPAFAIRGPNTLRTIPFRIGQIRNPWATQADMSLNKRFNFTDRYNAQIRLEAFNVTNTTIRVSPTTSPTDPNFGNVALNQANFPRQVQLGFKFNF